MKILVIRFSSIGDIVLTSPVVRCLKNQIPDSEIHFLTKKSFKDIPGNNPAVSKVYNIEKSVNEILPKLKNEGYSAVVDLHNNLRSSRVKLELNKKSYSFSKLNIKKWLQVNLKINALPRVHIVDRYFEAIRPMGVVNDNKGLDFFIPQDTLLNDFALHEKEYYAIVIGAKHFTKKLPNHKIVEVINRLDKQVVLIGGKEEAMAGAAIAENTKQQVFNACGKYNLNESALIIKNAIAVLSNDTGLMHIAAAFQKKIISVWGNTVPEFGMTPYLPGENSKIIELNNLSCRPCSKIGYSKCPKQHFKCMNDLETAEIAEALITK